MKKFGLILLGGALFGCDATLQGAAGGDDTDDSSSASGDGAGTGSTTQELKSQCEELGEGLKPGPSPLRRLTRAEYNNTVRDLAGDDTAPGALFPPEARALGFNGIADAQTVTSLLAEGYLDAAEGIADRATSELDGLLGCDPSDNGCVEDFIQEFGSRAYRRPLGANEAARLQTVFEWGRDNMSVAEGVQMVMEVLLQSPDFLYRPEFGEEEVEPGVVRLTSREMATRLSYLFLGSMPDEALRDAAERDELKAPEQIRAQAERLLSQPSARAVFTDFHSQWLNLEAVEHIERDVDVYPGYSAEIPHLLRQETEAFIEEVLFEDDGSLLTLFTAPYTMANDALAEFYGLTAPGSDEFSRVSVGTERAGLLTQGGLLAHHAQPLQTSPVHRGVFVHVSILCQFLEPQPANLEIVPPDLDPGLTTRERFSEHADNPGCRECHDLMDPVGLGFEHFDSVGRYRADENGIPIDASGELVQTDVDGPFYGAVELGRALASSSQVATCITKQWLRYSQGRSETPQDACSLAEVGQSFTESNFNIPSIVVALTETDAFLYREKVVVP